MNQQNLDKFISRKNKSIYIAGVPEPGQESFSSNLSRKIGMCPIVNMDCLIEAKLIDEVNVTEESLIELIKNVWMKETTKHTTFIMEGSTLLLYNSLGVRDSLIVLNNNISDWARNLTKFRCHLLADYVNKFQIFEDKMDRFIQGKNLKPVDPVSQLFLNK